MQPFALELKTRQKRNNTKENHINTIAGVVKTQDWVVRKRIGQKYYYNHYIIFNESIDKKILLL